MKHKKVVKSNNVICEVSSLLIPLAFAVKNVPEVKRITGKIELYSRLTSCTFTSPSAVKLLAFSVVSHRTIINIPIAAQQTNRASKNRKYSTQTYES